MSAIRPTDRDFLLSEISFDELVEIQLEAESRGWGTRWTSVEALRRQVAEAPLLLKSLLREERNGLVKAYRCLALFSLTEGLTKARFKARPNARPKAPAAARTPTPTSARVSPRPPRSVQGFGHGQNVGPGALRPTRGGGACGQPWRDR